LFPNAEVNENEKESLHNAPDTTYHSSSFILMQTKDGYLLQEGFTPEPIHSEHNDEEDDEAIIEKSRMSSLVPPSDTLAEEDI